MQGAALLGVVSVMSYAAAGPPDAKAPMKATQADFDFLIAQERFGRVLAPALILQRRMLIVDGANPQKELYELNFWFHNPTLHPLLGLHPYP